MITPITLISSRSVAEDYSFYDGRTPFNEKVAVVRGKWKKEFPSLVVQGFSLVHSALLTTPALKLLPATWEILKTLLEIN